LPSAPRASRATDPPPAALNHHERCRATEAGTALTLYVRGRIRQTDFGEGKVLTVSGDATKKIAEVQFGVVGMKRLLIDIAPIEKL
jgi:hypothetical protein